MTGRPTTYTPEVAEEICARLAEGESLASICRDEAQPKYRTIYGWLQRHDAFALNYASAREAQADADADAISDMAAQVRSGALDPTAARVAMDGYKWSAGKRKPKVYGDRSDLTLTINPFEGATDEQLVARALELRATLAPILAGKSATPGASGDRDGTGAEGQV